MPHEESHAWCEALKLVPARWRGEFCRFIEEGEANEEFLAFLERDGKCRLACETILRADHQMVKLLAAAAEPAVESRVETCEVQPETVSAS